MDILDPVTKESIPTPSPNPQSKQEDPSSTIDPVDTTTIDDETSKLNSKTEETMEKLEQEIEHAYESIEHKFQDLWSIASNNLQERYNLEEHKKNLINQLNSTKEGLNSKAANINISENLKSIEDQVRNLNLKDIQSTDIVNKANTALDFVDSKLEAIENQAGKYFSSFGSFFSNVISINPGSSSSSSSSAQEIETARASQDNEDEKVLFNSNLNNYNNYGTTRYDNDLFKLHTTQQSFLNSELDTEEDFHNFNVDDKTNEISNLLEKYPSTLKKTMNELVPVQLSYTVFWYRYFKQEAHLKELEEKRQQLLQRDHSKDTKTDEDEFTWSDDDDEEETDEVEESETEKSKEKSKAKPKSTPIEVEPTETRDKTPPTKALPEEDSKKTPPSKGSTEEERETADEDEDDDWE
ncbi:uncharacterized protein J8A68_004315 [[Candida] subhashii]|uniref:BSD domain-containing protein n=1 Tax=[Candida] subhashii TaxID=561895 RepID=A0A8J5QFV9_9ASCO|nr:uncharacterized protein J8A68_004315 [[Candida] subhashii]KAG7662187.1 hypothetical protein J8A68_004315 [[Candida] subhashii]